MAIPPARSVRLVPGRAGQGGQLWTLMGWRWVAQPALPALAPKISWEARAVPYSSSPEGGDWGDTGTLANWED